jgi:multidrug resistance efflux pump
MTDRDPDSFAAFARTNQLILRTRLGRDAGMIVAILILIGTWLSWLLLGRISVYAASQQMKLESELLPLRVEVPVEGVVTDCSLVLSREVAEGDGLVRLDTRSLELQREELQAELKADQSAIDALTRQLEAEEKARAAVAELAKRTQSAGNARVAASRTSSLYKSKETAITEKLHGAELASELDMIRASGEAASLRAQMLATVAQASLDLSNGNVNISDRDARIAALKKTLSDALALVEVHRSRLETVTYGIDRRTVRAGATGTLVDITPCMPGLDVTPGQVLATLLPRSDIHVVSFFRPEDAVGRVRRGQSARLRIDNFPWTQYGTVDAMVDRVGSEPRDGMVRVELKIVQPNPAIPMIHGLTGLAEIEVERISPFKLLLRMSGQLLSPKRDAPPAPVTGSGTS